jgi:hypothetical protein
MKWLLISVLMSTSVFAQNVTLKLSSGLSAHADYHQGQPNQAAILVENAKK